MLTMQDASLRLTEYWADRGCLITPPMNTEVGAGTLNPATALRAADELAGLLESPDFRRLAAALRRVQRIVPPGTAPVRDASRFTGEAERRLHAAFAGVADGTGADPAPARFVGFVGVLVEPIDDFFDKVLVMADDPALRAGRLGLLAAIADLSARVIDWRAITA